MRAAPRTKAFCAALSLVVAILCACHAKAAEHPNGTVIWQAGTPQGKWIAANTNQCGRPVNDGPQFTFALLMDGRNCTRNQANPVDADGGLILLALGQTYTWSWHEIDGPTPGMGPDNDARSLVWQIHGLHEPDSPCTRLAFINGPDEVSKPQMWGLSICSGLVWSGTYVAGESDDWKIVATISEGPDGNTRLYRNNILQGEWHGANAHHSPVHQYWWNFGPYKWRWQLPNGGGSSMTSVNQTIQNMRLVAGPE